MFFFKNQFFKSFFVLIVDRGFQLLSQLFTIFILAKYLGPIKYGHMVYAYGLFSIIYAITNAGIERTLVVELSASNQIRKKVNLFISAAIIKIVVSISVLVVLSLAYLYWDIVFLSKEVFYYLLLYSFSSIAYSWILIDAYNQSFSQVKYSAYSRIVACVLGLLLRYFLVKIDASIALIIFSFVLEQALCFLISIKISKGLILFFKQAEYKSFIFQSKIIKSGIFVMLSALCYTIYFRCFQVIVDQTLSPIYLGVFSIILNLLEIPNSLANILSVVITPKLAQMKVFINDGKELNSIVLACFIIIGLFAAICIIILGFLLNLFLANQFPHLFEYLVKGVIAIPIIFIGFCFTALILISQRYKLYFYISFVNIICIAIFWLSVMKFMTEDNAIYLYVISQLITALLIPIIINKNIFYILTNAVGFVFKPRFLFLKLKSQLAPPVF